jgi:hypothetical protein
MMNILNKRNMIKVAMLSLLTLGFSACGGGSDASFENSETMIDINIPCQTTPTTTDISNYITLNSGDVVVKEGNATVSIYHDINGTKKICLESGNAHIIRN